MNKILGIFGKNFENLKKNVRLITVLVKFNSISRKCIKIFSKFEETEIEKRFRKSLVSFG